MPKNPALFPATYTDRCPSTQANEVDRVGTLEQTILLLRSQLQAETRKSGRSIAESQNQTIPITRSVAPAVTVGKTFIGGGAEWDTGLIHGQIDKLTHYTDAIAPLDFTLTPRLRHSGVESSANGYWAGGDVDLASTVTLTIEAIDFATELRRTIAATLPASITYGVGVSSATRGYFCGQTGVHPSFISAPGGIRYIQFSTEATASIGASLGDVSGGCNAVQTSSAAYLAGGWGNTTTLRKFVFSTEAVTTLAVALSTARLAASTNESQRKGYFCGGASPTTGALSNTIDALTFATETMAVIGATLPRGDADCHGASSLRQGYHFYAFATPSQIAALNYPMETFGYVGSVLNRGGRYGTPVGKP